MRIYCARQLTDTGNKYLRSSQYEVAMGAAEPPSRKELLAGARGADGAIVTLTEKIDRKFFDVAGQQLKVVANVAVGFDNIDLAEAKKRGVRITNTPGVLSGATADHTRSHVCDDPESRTARERRRTVLVGETRVELGAAHDDRPRHQCGNDDRHHRIWPHWPSGGQARSRLRHERSGVPSGQSGNKGR